MNTCTKIDADVLDELVCGGLSRERYREILTSLEATPSKWRDCALAFLQEQAIAEEISSLAKRDISWDDTGALASVLTEKKAGEDREVVDGRKAGDQVQRMSMTERNHSQLVWMQKITSLAALLLVSFTVGWMGSGLWQQDAVEQVADQGTNNSDSTNSIVGNGFEQNTPQLSWPDTLPVASNTFLPIDREVPAALRELERRGRIRIESIEGFVPMEFEDGSSVLVPTQQFKVVPVIHSY